jgi:inhibitor of cysteine peptidase
MEEVYMRFTILFCFLLGITWAISGCNPGGNIIHLTKQDDGSTIEAHKGDLIELTVEGNPTTGYTWEWIEGENALVELKGEPAYSSDSDLVGSGGVFKFVFQVKDSGEGALQLVYHRTFEPDVPPLEEFSVTLQVKE